MAQAQPTARRQACSPWIWLVPLAAVFGAGATSRPIDSVDFWWHLANGRVMWNEHRLPLRDQFSFTAAGEYRVPQEWLAEGTLYAAYHAGGWRGVMAWRGLFAGALVLLMGSLAWRRGATGWIALLMVALGAVISFPEWMARPKIVAPVLTGVTLLLLDAEQRNSRRAIWLIPAVLWLWANLHASFAIGAFLVLLRAGVAAFQPESRQVAKRLGLAAVAGLLLAMITPGGVRTLVTPLQYILGFGARWSVEVFQEWMSPDFHQSTGRSIELLLVVLIVGLAVGRWRPTTFDLLALLMALHLSLTSIRHCAVLAVIGAPMAAEAAQLAWGRVIETHGTNLRALGGRISRGLGRAPRVLPVALSVTVTCTSLALGVPRDGSAERCLVTENLPRLAVKKAEDLTDRGNLFNEYEWGGYIIWETGGRLPVFIDSRADLYSKGMFHEYWTTYQGAPTWRSRFAKYGIGVVLVQADAPLAYRLEADPEWELVHSDALAVLYARKAGGKLRRPGSQG